MYSRKDHITLLDQRVFELERVCEKQIGTIKKLEDFIEHPPSRPYCTSCYELKTRIKELEEGSCRFNCRTAKAAFMAGFDAGSEYCFDGGRIICDAFYHEITEAAYKEFCVTE